jgi:NAD(P)-dependent dehydrogenase (short-subunit alcohol dehydrogenase family)
MSDVLVTGAGRGLGLEFTKQLVERGHRVFATVRDPSRAALLKMDDVVVVKLDISDPASVAEARASVGEHSDSLSLLVNNAGINSKSMGIPEEQRNLKFGDLEPEGLVQMFRTNAVGPLLVTQAFADLLEGGGKVLFVSSWLGSITEKRRAGGNYGYSGSKAALNMFGRLAGYDLKTKGISSTILNPGWVRTAMGGQDADLSAEESVSGMLDLADALTLDNSTGFVDHDGKPRPF